VPAKITALIPAQRYETVRDRIGTILALELANQFTLSDDEEVLNAIVWSERVVPFDATDMPCVNVMLGQGDYSNKHQGQVDGTYVYYIDCYTAAPNDDTVMGDKRAALDVQRLGGVIRAILENPIYKTLDFAAPLITAVAINSLAMAVPQNVKDATNAQQLRLELQVTVPEITALTDPALLAGNDTTVILEETELGYRWVYNATEPDFNADFNNDYNAEL
jgi:hypothetical protein